MKTYIYPYMNGSKSVKALASATKSVRIKREGSRFVPKPNKLVVNWGCTEMPAKIQQGPILNNPAAVATATNKLEAFKAMGAGQVRIPRYVELKEWAADWIEEDGVTVVCRTKLRGHSGDGIVMAITEEELVNAPLYVEYKKKADEYRIHVFQGRVIFIQRKARKADVPDEKVNWQVRNLAGGFIFANKDVEAPMDCIEQAVKAVTAIGLDFGAVDVIYNKHEEAAYVLEVNTAPGLEGTTLERYEEAVKRAAQHG